MYNINCNYAGKAEIQTIQKVLSSMIILSVVFSIAYFIYWLGVMSDDMILDYTGSLFTPLANLLNPDNNSLDIYKLTSIKLFLAVIPLNCIQYFLSKYDESLYKAHLKEEEKYQKLLKQEAQVMKETRYDCINKYSICLSVDYTGKKEFSLQNKQKLNSVIFDKINSKVKRIDNLSTTSMSDVLIVNSTDFKKYDLVYDSILRILSTAKTMIKNKYQLNMIPSMTTDAYTNRMENENIRREHFEIQSFNFKNRALSTATFSKKYQHLKQNKYAGIPIGEYAYFNKGRTDTYELNVIHKDLSKTLSQT